MGELICVSMHGPTAALESHMSLSLRPSNTYPTVLPQMSLSPISLLYLCLPPIGHSPPSSPNKPPLPSPSPFPSLSLPPHSLSSSFSHFNPTRSLSLRDCAATKMMIHQAMNNQNSINTAKTAEIMSRYRPIAPKPELIPADATSDGGSPESQKIQQSPYLRNVWADLQARPTRTRKRGRTSLGPSTMKRSRTAHLYAFPPPNCHLLTAAQNMSMHGFAHGPEAQDPSTLVTLPLLPCPIMAPAHETESGKNCVIDLNRLAEVTEERDFLKLQTPISSLGQPKILAPPMSPIVISPQPVRPVGSSISVGSISEDSLGSNTASEVPKKKREEVESEVESEELPAVVSDKNNKVRLANSAYKEMVGQPECRWLDSMMGAFSSCKRISGEVMLQFLGVESMPVESNGFSCWVKIEWGSNGDGSGSVHAFCEVVRLSCESKDYLFEWRFHTREASESAASKA